MKSKILETMTSSNNDEHQTPQWLFDYLDRVFEFNLDVCATAQNTKCNNFFTKENSCLDKPFGIHEYTFWMNPPYSKPENACKPKCEKKKCIERGYHLDKRKPGKIDFIAHAYQESLGFTRGVMLVKNDPTTEWYKRYIRKADYRIFLDKRVRFELPEVKQTSAPHSSILAFFGFSLYSNEVKYLSKLGEVVPQTLHRL